MTGDEGAAPRAILGAVDDEGWISGPCGGVVGELVDDYDDEPCEHEHDEECYDYNGFLICHHTHCFNCGGCRCPGYCDDFQTYNLRPAETGGDVDESEA